MGVVRTAWSLLNRGLARISTFHVLFWAADIFGLIDGYIEAVEPPDVALVCGLVGLTLSALLDLYDIATRPDMMPKSCRDDEPRLPMEEE